MASLHLQLHGPMHMMLIVVVLDLYHQAAVEAAVACREAMYRDGEVAMVVGGRFNAMAPGQALVGAGMLVAMVVEV